MKDGDGTYISGQIPDHKRIEYYKSVVSFLCYTKGIVNQYPDEETPTSYRMLIDKLMGVL